MAARAEERAQLGSGVGVVEIELGAEAVERDQDQVARAGFLRARGRPTGEGKEQDAQKGRRRRLTATPGSAGAR